MIFCVFSFFTLATLSAVHVEGAAIDADKVQPFVQPEPVTISDKAAVKFKPQLKLSGTCHPYPAVDAKGDVSAGNEPFWTILNDCGGSELGSQVYARSTWRSDYWAIMYAWFFPKGFSYGMGHAAEWEYAIVWINNPDLENPAILGLTVQSEESSVKRYAPVDPEYIDGTSVKINYYYKFIAGETYLQPTTKKGGYQDLITWDQLPDVARAALNSTEFYSPLADEVYEKALSDGWPF